MVTDALCGTMGVRNRFRPTLGASPVGVSPSPLTVEVNATCNANSLIDERVPYIVTQFAGRYFLTEVPLEDGSG